DAGTTGGAGAGGTADAGCSCPTGKVCSRLPPVHCYDPFWAEWPASNSYFFVNLPDAGTVALPHPKIYDTYSIAGVVIDQVTGLHWQRAVELGGDGGTRTLSWTDAQTYCANLALAGGGWRVPTKIELLSIVDYTKNQPAINPTPFPATPGVH